uniref:Uncharacterized protein n=1 Tax=Cacopsylla melanoneura TaxID=428564 RepID=A0A8D8XC31_9HEMI
MKYLLSVLKFFQVITHIRILILLTGNRTSHHQRLTKGCHSVLFFILLILLLLQSSWLFLLILLTTCYFLSSYFLFFLLLGYFLQDIKYFSHTCYFFCTYIAFPNTS